jgi:ribosomal protein S19E (S16A)
MDDKFAALTLDEWTTLRRIAEGIRNPRALGALHVARLQKRGLVTQTPMGLTLSDAGQSCLESGAAEEGVPKTPSQRSL